MKKFFIILSSLLIGNSQFSVSASNIQENKKDSVTIYFRVGQSNIDLSYIDNAAQLSTLKYKIRKLYRENKIHNYNITVFAGASPEGQTSLNDDLAETRAKTIISALGKSTPLSRRDVALSIQGVDWNSLIALVDSAYQMPYKEEMLSVLRYTPEKSIDRSVVVYKRKEMMESLYGGIPYRWMYDHIFRRLRYASVVIDTCQVPKTEVIRDTLVKVVHLPGDTIVNTVTVMKEAENTEKAKNSFFFALKNNALYDVMALPNIGLEFYLKDNWSITGNWMYSRWRSDSKHRYWSIYGGDIGARKWLGKLADERPLAGHHVGFFLQGLSYDVEFGSKGYISDKWNFGASFEYGFSLPITKRINFDFSVGLGYFGGKNKKYRPKEVDGDSEYVWQEDNHFNWFGPTKAEASLVILLGKGVNNHK